MQGIREHSKRNIDYVTNFFRAKASAAYGKKLMDIEAAMSSKNSTAVKNYIDEKLKKIEKKKEWKSAINNSNFYTDRKKSNSSNKPPLGERSSANKE